MSDSKVGQHSPLLILVVVIANLFQTPLELFQHEAEKALGRSIVIIDSDDIGTSNGQTFCDQNPVLIKVRKGFDQDLHDQILAHELGHALLCARRIFTFGWTTDVARAEGVEAIASDLATMIGSCYIDPLVDAEAAKRGFNPEKLGEQLLRTVKTHSKQEVREWVTQFGELSSDLTAIGIYCAELKYHSLLISELEKIYEDESKVKAKLHLLRLDLGRRECNDSESCYAMTRRLRDEFDLRQFIVLRNPSTGRLE